MTFNKKLNELSENRIEIKSDVYYSLIIGMTPSFGARSPLLWNSVFEACESNIRMVPLDVTHDNFDKLMEVLKYDEYFIGGSITNPYKIEILNHLVNGHNKTSVNTIRRNDEGYFEGENTDALAWLNCFESKFGKLESYKNIALLGFGGVGASILNLLKNDKPALDCTVISRSSRNINSYTVKTWEDFNKSADVYDVIINATPLELTDLPVDDIRKKVKSVLYDVRYINNNFSTEMEKDFLYTDGSCMNFEQAILGFLYCTSRLLNIDIDIIKSNMKEVKLKHGW